MKELQYWSEEPVTKIVTKTGGYWVHYKDNEPKLDITTGFGAFILGYNNKKVLEDIHENYSINFLRGHSGETCEQVIELANIICDKGNWANIAWAVSGSDAVECAIAMNDRYWMNREEHRPIIISFDPSYHGTTMLGKHLRGKYKDINRVKIIESPSWNNLEDRETSEEKVLADLTNLLENNEYVGCLIMESHPWSGKMLPWSKNWWNKIRKICDENDILFIVDDVAVCWGKNSSWFGYQIFDVQPDIASLGKALTGGYSPLGAAVCNNKVSQVIKSSSWNHGHTWQPNLYGVTASLAVTKYIEERNLFSKVSEINLKLKEIAREFSLPVKGDHLMVSYEFPRVVDSQDLFNVGLCSGIPIDDPDTGRIKLIPPLIADDEYFEVLKKSIKSLL